MHRINRVEIELIVGDTGLARDLTERVSRVHASRIAPAIDRVCSEISDTDDVDRIDVLELDLGVLCVDGFEDELVEKLAAALRSSLATALGRRSSREQPTRAALELVETFALSGSLPWWADPRDRDVVARHFARVARDAESELIELVRRLGADEGALDRIARACDAEALVAVARRAGFDERAARSTELSVRRAALAALAGTAPVLPRTHFELDETAHMRPTLHAADAAASDWREPVAGGAIPGAGGAADRTAAGGLPRAGHRRAPARSHDALADRADPIEAIARELARPEPLAAEHAGVLPAAHPLAVSPGADTPADAVRAAATAEEPVALRQAPSRPVSPPAPRPGLVRERRRAALAKLDEVYVDDAGLVILWPFLERFFARVGLLDDRRRFATDTASLQAVALLELLAVPDSPLLEFELPLAKLLCGRPLESDFILEELPSDEQRAEGEHLLAAVIDHVKVLGELSTDGFRATFLQRRGALTTRDGAWLLQVERQTHDVLLDRFPWSWTWVKLPWMPDALRVEW